MNNYRVVRSMDFLRSLVEESKQISPRDENLIIKQVLRKFCSTILTDKDREKDLALICCLSQRTNFDLIADSLALYNRDPAKFRSLQPLFQQQSASALYNALFNVIKVCHVRLFSDPDLMGRVPYTYKIMDDINVFVEIWQSFTELVQGTLFPQNVQNEKPKFHAFPLRIDLWIIPRDIQCDDVDQEATSNVIPRDIGDITKRMSEYFKLPLVSMAYLELSEFGKNDRFRSIRSVLTYWRKQNQFRRYRRYIMIVDRRNGKSHIYFFGVKKADYLLPSKHAAQWSLMNFCRSKEFLLPASSTCSQIGLYDRLHRIFCISYDFYCADNIAAYFIFNGCQTRFYPCDVYKLWPRLFHEQCNKIKIPFLQDQDEWSMFTTDTRFDDFCALCLTSDEDDEHKEAESEEESPTIDRFYEPNHTEVQPAIPNNTESELTRRFKELQQEHQNQKNVDELGLKSGDNDDDRDTSDHSEFKERFESIAMRFFG